MAPAWWWRPTLPPRLTRSGPRPPTSTFRARFSDEFTGADWDDGHDGAALGATFTGRNHREDLGDWEVRCFVDVCDKPTVFGWCTSEADNPGARWRFEFQPLMGGGTRLLFRLLLGPGSFRVDHVHRAGSRQRTTHHRQPPPRPPDQYGASSRGHQGPCRSLSRRFRITFDQSGVAPEISATDANRDQSSRDSVSGRARLSIPARANPAESR